MRARHVLIVRDSPGQPARVYEPKAPRARLETYREARAMCRAGYIGGAVAVAQVPPEAPDPCYPGADLSPLLYVAQWVRVRGTRDTGFPCIAGGEL